jgi:hypothetical protein
MANKTFNLLDELNWITSGEPVSGDFRTGNSIIPGVANRVPRQLQGLIQAIAPMLSTDLGDFRSQYIEEQEKLDLRYNSIVILPKKGGGEYAIFQVERTLANYRDKGYCYVTNQTKTNIVIDDIRDINDAKSQVTLAPGRSVKLVPFLYTSRDTNLSVKAESIEGFDGASLTSNIETLPAPMSLPKGITIWNTSTRARLIKKGNPDVNGNNSGIIIGLSTGVDVAATNGFSALLIGINKLGVITLRSSFNGAYINAYTEGDAEDGIITDDRQVTADGRDANIQSGQSKWLPRYEIKPTYNANTTKDGIVNIFDERITPKANTVIGAQTYLALLDKLNRLTSTVEDGRYSRNTSDSQSKATTEDPNTTRDSLILTNHRNCPTEGRAYWVQTYFNKNTRLRWQTATWADPNVRNGVTLVYSRTAMGEDGSTNQWTPWTQINTPNQIDAATDNTFTGSNTFNKGINVKGLRENGGSHINEDATNKNAPLYVDYENNQLVSNDSSVAYPLARVKVNDSAFTTGVVGNTRANNVTRGYHSLVTPDGAKVWSYMRNGDFVANHGDIITSTGEKLSEALVYRGNTRTTDRTELKSGHYTVGIQSDDKLQAQFIAEAEAQGLTIPSSLDHQLLQVNSPVQDFGILIGGANYVYLRVNDTGNNGGEQTYPNVVWSQLITSKNVASTDNVGAVKLASTWKEQTQNVVPVSMFRELVEKSVLVGDGVYDENTRGVSNLSNLEPWGSSAIGYVSSNSTQIDSQIRPDVHPYGIVLKLGQGNATNAKIYIPHSVSRLNQDVTRRLSCFYLISSHQKTANDRGESDYKSNWFKFLSTDYFAGIPLPWPMQEVPDGFLAMNGAAFDKRRYPRLSMLYPSGRLPDLRGEFIRGWDANRGIDPGRALLSWQVDDDKKRRVDFSSVDVGGYEGVFYDKNVDSSQTRVYVPNQTQAVFGSDIKNMNDSWVHTYKVGTPSQRGKLIPGENSWYDYYVSLQWGSGDQTRPRNVAFQYICYAA